MTTKLQCRLNALGIRLYFFTIIRRYTINVNSVGVTRRVLMTSAESTMLLGVIIAVVGIIAAAILWLVSLLVEIDFVSQRRINERCLFLVVELWSAGAGLVFLGNHPGNLWHKLNLLIVMHFVHSPVCQSEHGQQVPLHPLSLQNLAQALDVPTASHGVAPGIKPE